MNWVYFKENFVNSSQFWPIGCVSKEMGIDGWKQGQHQGGDCPLSFLKRKKERERRGKMRKRRKNKMKKMNQNEPINGSKLMHF